MGFPNKSKAATSEFLNKYVILKGKDPKRELTLAQKHLISDLIIQSHHEGAISKK